MESTSTAYAYDDDAAMLQLAWRATAECEMRARQMGLRHILKDFAGDAADNELRGEMEAALWTTICKMPAMLLLDPSAVAWDVFVDTWSGDYLERSFAISKRRADGSPLFRDLEERQIVEQERRAAVRARLETATKGKELKACCVEFGLPASGGKSVLAARLRAFADGGAPPKKRGRPLASANGAPASKRRRS